MKKLITLCTILFLAFTANAQTSDETLEWLRTKQSAIRYITSDVVKSGADLKIDENSLKVSAGDKSTNIQWSKIKDVRGKNMEITIVSSDLVDSKNTFIVISVDSSVAQKYAKALKHLATLKGAKLVNDELFN